MRSPELLFFIANDSCMGCRKPAYEIGRTLTNAAGGRNCEVLAKGKTVGGRISPGKGIRETPGTGKRDDVGS